mmetsp:Transcript_56902/g.169812  ORF Transcript_56902/g.169812 Transcript_56902/m.169812 type:complete len:164 (+) Transcript_56902:304-795(+)
MAMISSAFVVIVVLCLLGDVHSQTCSSLSACSGHGTCNPTTDQCSCDPGWGASTDVAYYKAPDCSLRTCQSGRAWADVPTASNSAHKLAECSNKGTCDRTAGVCNCYPGFEGGACERMKCPNDCSGHGQCLPVKQMATLSNALPLSPTTTYTGLEVRFHHYLL